MDRWEIRFLLGKRELAAKLAEFLEAHLNPAYSREARFGEVIVGNCRDIDEAWRVALIRHNSGLKPRFVIEGRDERALLAGSA